MSDLERLQEELAQARRIADTARTPEAVRADLVAAYGDSYPGEAEAVATGRIEAEIQRIVQDAL